MSVIWSASGVCMYYLIRWLKGTCQTLGQFNADERRSTLKKNWSPLCFPGLRMCNESNGMTIVMTRRSSHLPTSQLSRVLPTKVRKVKRCATYASISITHDKSGSEKVASAGPWQGIQLAFASVASRWSPKLDRKRKLKRRGLNNT